MNIALENAQRIEAVQSLLEWTKFSSETAIFDQMITSGAITSIILKTGFIINIPTTDEHSIDYEMSLNIFLLSQLYMNCSNRIMKQHLLSGEQMLWSVISTIIKRENENKNAQQSEESNNCDTERSRTALALPEAESTKGEGSDIDDDLASSHAIYLKESIQTLLHALCQRHPKSILDNFRTCKHHLHPLTISEISKIDNTVLLNYFDILGDVADELIYGDLDKISTCDCSVDDYVVNMSDGFLREIGFGESDIPRNPVKTSIAVRTIRQIFELGTAPMNSAGRQKALQALLSHMAPVLTLKMVILARVVLEHEDTSWHDMEVDLGVHEALLHFLPTATKTDTGDDYILMLCHVLASLESVLRCSTGKLIQVVQCKKIFKFVRGLSEFLLNELDEEEEDDNDNGDDDSDTTKIAKEALSSILRKTNSLMLTLSNTKLSVDFAQSKSIMNAILRTMKRTNHSASAFDIISNIAHNVGATDICCYPGLLKSIVEAIHEHGTEDDADKHIRSAAGKALHQLAGDGTNEDYFVMFSSRKRFLQAVLITSDMDLLCDITSNSQRVEQMLIRTNMVTEIISTLADVIDDNNVSRGSESKGRKHAMLALGNLSQNYEVVRLMSRCNRLLQGLGRAASCISGENVDNVAIQVCAATVFQRVIGLVSPRDVGMILSSLASRSNDVVGVTRAAKRRKTSASTSVLTVNGGVNAVTPPPIIQHDLIA